MLVAKQICWDGFCFCGWVVVVVVVTGVVLFMVLVKGWCLCAGKIKLIVLVKLVEWWWLSTWLGKTFGS